MRIGEKGSTEVGGGGRSSRDKDYLRGTRRSRRENPLVGHVEEESMVTEKIRPQDGQRDQS